MARYLVCHALDLWERERPDRRPAVDILAEETISRFQCRDSRERSLFRAIFYGVIRYRLLLDFLLDQFLDRPAKVPTEIKNILKAALFQLVFMDRIPPSAAVNEAVNLAKTSRFAWAGGLVNAVLRNIVRQHGNEIERLVLSLKPEDFSDIDEFLSVSESYPLWMVRRWIALLGKETAVSLCHAGNSSPPVTLRVNTMKWIRDEALDYLERNGVASSPCRYSPDGIILDSFKGNPAELPNFSTGGFMVQDEASQLVSLLADPKPGMKILDLCAGSGGKTTHLAMLAKDKAHITATDINARRLALLEENLKRLNLHSVKVVDLESAFSNGAHTAGQFDLILVDAPCSGLGVIRRRPDIKWNRTDGDIPRLAQLQSELLEQASRLCRKEGKIIYAVCTLEPEETEQVIYRFLRLHSDWHKVDLSSALPRQASPLIANGFMKTSPALHNTDGFFSGIVRQQVQNG